jgi:cytidine deaminase
MGRQWNAEPEENTASPLGITTDVLEQLKDSAKQAATRAYAPYSRLSVGAAVLTESGEVFMGCNVENASYGLAICAERAAIFAAVGALGPNMRLRAVAVFSNGKAGASPCGACRQVICEFGHDVVVAYFVSQGWEVTTSGQLLPQSFIMKA